jgi:putative NADPH-quinone reductase
LEAGVIIAIVYEHPPREGINADIRSTLIEHLRETGQAYSMIDLYDDGFSPAKKPNR